MIKTLSLDTVKLIHEHLTQYFAKSEDPISPPGIRNEGLLESAVHKQHAGFDGYQRYGSPTNNAAALMYGLCLNHPFHNGNKRTALLCGIMHLDLNGLSLTNRVNRDDLYELMIALAAHEALPGIAKRGIRKKDQDSEIRALDDWLKDRTRKIERGERTITFGELYDIVNSFDHLRVGSKKKGNFIEILRRGRGLFGGERWTVVYKVPCPGDSRTVSIQVIKDLRKALRLDEENGVDSHSFYGTQTVIDSFIMENRKVLRRLART